MAWSDGLTVGTQPYEIAASTNSRVRVIAGPGTGKSYAMKRRVARLLESGVDPAVILPVTFTRVAAEDLHRELVSMNVPGFDQLVGTTLHSLAMRILGRNHVLEATGRVARPLNQFELKPMRADLVTANRNLTEIGERLKAYEAAWARLQHEAPGAVVDPADAAFRLDLVNWLQFHEAMLIGEAIPVVYEYLRLNPAAPERGEFAHILVDEYQDLNKAEQGVIRLLSDNADVCIVGDDDQSIYSFKNARPEGIQEWLQGNQGAQDLQLDECRRCPTLVAEMANSLISHNVQRPVPRQLTPYGNNGPGVVQILQFQALADEVAGVANRIANLIANGTAPGDILVLAQRGVIGTPIYEALKAQHIPVKSYYAESELDHEEAQRRLSLLKLFVDREDRVALRWLVGLNASNWNASGYRRVRARCELTGDSPWTVLQLLSAGAITISLTGNVVAKFNGVVAELEALEQLPNLAAVIDSLFPHGMEGVTELRALADECLGEIEESDRAELLNLLVTSITQPEIPTEIQEVRVMSLHKSKGLSAPVTIIAGCVEGLLPQQPRAGTPPADAASMLEEQRRLFYVGVSRVKAAPGLQKPGTLLLTYSRRMTVQQAKNSNITPAHTNYGVAHLNASRFLGELGPAAPTPVAG